MVFLYAWDMGAGILPEPMRFTSAYELREDGVPGLPAK